MKVAAADLCVCTIQYTSPTERWTLCGWCPTLGVFTITDHTHQPRYITRTRIEIEYVSFLYKSRIDLYWFIFFFMITLLSYIFASHFFKKCGIIIIITEVKLRPMSMMTHRSIYEHDTHKCFLRIINSSYVTGSPTFLRNKCDLKWVLFDNNFI